MSLYRQVKLSIQISTVNSFLELSKYLTIYLTLKVAWVDQQELCDLSLRQYSTLYNPHILAHSTKILKKFNWEVKLSPLLGSGSLVITYLNKKMNTNLTVVVWRMVENRDFYLDVVVQQSTYKSIGFNTVDYIKLQKVVYLMPTVNFNTPAAVNKHTQNYIIFKTSCLADSFQFFG